MAKFIALLLKTAQNKSEPRSGRSQSGAAGLSYAGTLRQHSEHTAPHLSLVFHSEHTAPHPFPSVSHVERN